MPTLSQLSGHYRAELVLRMLDVSLQDITSPATTIEIVAMIARRLTVTDAKERGMISRIIVKASDKIPEAARGDQFHRYGKAMRRVVWYPKGTLPEGGITRKAHRRQRTDRELFLAHCAERGIDPATGLSLNPEVWSA